MKIDQHISQLLYHHDCVIVPGFGGFVTNSQPARIHPVQHQFYPPSKSLGFNIHLRRNDG
ncbi:MAG: SPOR domain-containing protein, partial [Nitrosopumilus sp.]|nr:SPOR domain-containing protein [Nitrosopumilus sp.]